jgi:hypothetical protein
LRIIALYKGERIGVPEVRVLQRAPEKRCGNRCASVLFQHFPSLGTAYLFRKFVMSRFGKDFGEQVGKVIIGRYIHKVEGASFE